MKAVTTLAALAALTLGAGSGCVVIANVNTTTSGQAVPSETFQQVKPGETTETWLLKVLGKPTATEVMDDGVRVLRYDWSEKSEGQVAVFLLLSSNVNEQNRHSAYFEVKDGVVRNCWQVPHT